MLWLMQNRSFIKIMIYYNNYHDKMQKVWKFQYSKFAKPHECCQIKSLFINNLFISMTFSQRLIDKARSSGIAVNGLQIVPSSHQLVLFCNNHRNHQLPSTSSESKGEGSYIVPLLHEERIASNYCWSNEGSHKSLLGLVSSALKISDSICGKNIFNNF